MSVYSMASKQVFQYLAFLFVILFSVFQKHSWAQQEILLKKGFNRGYLGIGKQVLPKLKSGYAVDIDWRTFCQKDMLPINDSIWTFKGVYENETLLFERVKTFQYDTIAFVTISKMTREAKRALKQNWRVANEFFNEEGDLLIVYRQSLTTENFSVKIEEIESLHFSRITDCKNDIRIELGIIAALGVLGAIAAPISYGFAPISLVYVFSGAVGTFVALNVFNSYRVKKYDFNEWKVVVK
jgi:hypothetical protein